MGTLSDSRNYQRAKNAILEIENKLFLSLMRVKSRVNFCKQNVDDALFKAYLRLMKI